MTTYEGYGADLNIEGDVLIVTKKGLGAKALGTSGARRIPLQALTGVNFKDATRLINGWLQLVVAGDPVGKAEASEPNTILFRHKSQAQFVSVRDYLLGVIEANRSQGIDPTTVTVDPPAMSRLQRAQEREERMRERQERMQEHGEQMAADGYRQRHDRLVETLGGAGVAREDIVEAAASMQWRLGGGREIKKLPEHLQAGETVRKIGQGKYRNDQGIVVLTNSRLLFLFHGMMRKTLEDFPLAAISSVTTSSGMINGVLKVFVSGNEAVVSNVIKADLEPLAAALRQEITRVKTSDQTAHAGQAMATGADPLSQIAKLAELRDAGALTTMEFEAKKAELLGRI